MNTLSVTYLHVIKNKIKTHGFGWAIKKMVTRCLKELSWFCLLPLSVPLHALHIRQLLIRVEHIGHLAVEFDCMEKARQLGLLDDKKNKYFVLAPLKTLSNAHMLRYWETQATVISHPFLCGFLALLTRRYFMRVDVSSYISTFFGTQEIYHINRLWDSRPPLLRLSIADETWSEEVLPQLGIAKGRWYVCFHAREGHFLPHNEIIQTHRNTQIAHMTLAMKEVIARGGFVIRVGDPSMTPLEAKEGVIDYAHHPLKSERLDVILCAKAKCFLGCTSGLAFVSMVFGVPVAQANMIPVQALAVCKQDLSIPKRLYSLDNSRYLSFQEILASEVGGYYFSYQYEAARIAVEENTSEDILALIIEILDRIDGVFLETAEESALHAQYLALFKPGHYAYGAASRVGLAFLTKYFR